MRSTAVIGMASTPRNEVGVVAMGNGDRRSTEAASIRRGSGLVWPAQRLQPLANAP
jgi:hypothetical protein